jgi:hypothetical protein
MTTHDSGHKIFKSAREVAVWDNYMGRLCFCGDVVGRFMSHFHHKLTFTAEFNTHFAGSTLSNNSVSQNTMRI